MSEAKIRKAAVAGTFYPASKMVLERDLSLLLENSPIVELTQPIRAIIAPHAGYMYSGGVAARAYRQIMSRKYDFHVILAPSHYEVFDFISIYPGSAFGTPLGQIPIAREIVEELVSQDAIFRLSEFGYSEQEHSLEVQLPLLKWVQDAPRIVPLMMGEQTSNMIEDASQLLTHALTDKNCLIIASTDLSHFHPDREARSLDEAVIKHINKYQPDELYADIMEKRCEMCGYGPAIIAMKTARALGAKKAQVLLYRNSSDMTGDLSSVVGYLSAIVY